MTLFGSALTKENISQAGDEREVGILAQRNLATMDLESLSGLDLVSPGAVLTTTLWSVPRVSTGGAPTLHLVVSSSGEKVTALHPPGRESLQRLNVSRRVTNCGRAGRHFFSWVAVGDVDFHGGSTTFRKATEDLQAPLLVFFSLFFHWTRCVSQLSIRHRAHPLAGGSDEFFQVFPVASLGIARPAKPHSSFSSTLHTFIFFLIFIFFDSSSSSSSSIFSSSALLLQLLLLLLLPSLPSRLVIDSLCAIRL